MYTGAAATWIVREPSVTELIARGTEHAGGEEAITSPGSGDQDSLIPMNREASLRSNSVNPRWR